MKNFSYVTANSIIVEFGALERLGDIVAELGAKRIIVITDQGIVKAGLLGRAVHSLQKAGLQVCSYENVVPDPSEDVVSEAETLAKEYKAEGVVGLGGGSSMDVAKLVSFLLRSSQKLPEIYGVGQAKGPRLPLVQVPTTAGTGSEVTGASVITSAKGQKRSVVASQLLPDVAVLDAELTLGLPAEITAATGVDSIVHAIEAYTSKVKKNPISDIMARAALRLLTSNIRTVVTDSSNREARSNMLVGATFAGQAFGNSTVGAVHAFAHTLGGHFHVPHGLANSLMLPHVMRFNVTTSAKEYAELASIILPDAGEDSDEFLAHRLVDYLEALIADLKLPTKLKQVGIMETHLSFLAKEAMKEERLLSFNPRKVDHNDALEIFRQAL